MEMTVIYIKKAKTDFSGFGKVRFCLKKGCQISDSPLITSMDIKKPWTPLNPRKNDLTEIILTYASSSEGAFPFLLNSGIMPSSSANTVEVTVTDSHRFPFRKIAKALKGNHKTHDIHFSNCNFILSLQIFLCKSELAENQSSGTCFGIFSLSTIVTISQSFLSSSEA